MFRLFYSNSDYFPGNLGMHPSHDGVRDGIAYATHHTALAFHMRSTPTTYSIHDGGPNPTSIYARIICLRMVLWAKPWNPRKYARNLLNHNLDGHMGKAKQAFILAGKVNSVQIWVHLADEPIRSLPTPRAKTPSLQKQRMDQIQCRLGGCLSLCDV